MAGPDGVRVIGQANNVFIFPGLGLGAIVAEASRVTDDMFIVAAHELARLVSEERLRTGALYPPVASLRAVARAIAIAVVREARDRGLGRDYPDGDVEAAVDRRCGGRLRPVRAGALLGDQTRSKAIATDPPPPRHRVARP